MKVQIEVKWRTLNWLLQHLQQIYCGPLIGLQNRHFLAMGCDQLCKVMQPIFKLSLSLGKFLVLWKTFCMVPVPKFAHPGEHNHIPPVVLTSNLSETIERILLTHLLTSYSTWEHWDYVGIICFDTSSAFSGMLEGMGVDSHLSALMNVLKRASSVLDCPREFCWGAGWMLTKLTSIMENTSHPGVWHCGGFR